MKSKTLKIAEHNKCIKSKLNFISYSLETAQVKNLILLGFDRK